MVHNKSNENLESFISNTLDSFISKYVDIKNKDTLLISSSDINDFINFRSKKYHSIINLHKINNTRFVNKYLEAANKKLIKNGIYIGKVETYPNRKKLILNKYFFPYNRIVYFIDLFFNRVFPKLWLTKKLYFFYTKGIGRVISKAEIFGRLYSCGFEILAEKDVNFFVFFVARKIKDPYYDKHPTYGLFIRLKRIGKNGIPFNVYKLRTMHPFSEYLQEYIYEINKLRDGGKINDDFRVSHEGRILRKFWIDELPMLINLLKGNVKIVGVRPLSAHYFNLYSDSLKEKRILFKPGLIPPFYADMPSTIDEIMQSEMRYLHLYEKSPVITDLKYFFKAFNNIIFKRKRSN